MKKQAIVVLGLWLSIAGLMEGCTNSTAIKPSGAGAQTTDSSLIKILPHELHLNGKIKWEKSGEHPKQKSMADYRISRIYNSALGEKCIKAERNSQRQPVLFCHVMDDLYQMMPVLSEPPQVY